MSETGSDALLPERMATSATGFGAIIGGTLDIRTVTETRNMAALLRFGPDLSSVSSSILR